MSEKTCDHCEAKIDRHGQCECTVEYLRDCNRRQTKDIERLSDEVERLTALVDVYEHVFELIGVKILGIRR